MARIAAVSLPDAWSERGFHAELARPSARAVVACAPGTGAIAYALGFRVLDEVQLLSLAVLPRWRRRGVARQLIGSYLARLRSEGARRVALEVRRSNRGALALYSGFGMRLEGERPGYYRDGEGALLLGLNL